MSSIFRVKPWKIEARHYIRSYATDALVISPKNTMQKVVPIERCVKFAVEDTPVLHGLKIQKHKKKGNNKGADTKEEKPEEVK